MENQINQVSDTAFMAAAYRAMETNHPDAIFLDPFAEKLAGDRGKKIIDNLPKQAFIGGWSVVIRTRIIDDFIQDAIIDGVDTVLNLGAGLDTRPYRLELPESLRWIEVDYPDVIELKETRLSEETPRCQLERVKMDLADISARRTLLDEASANSKKVLVLTEAVTPYLSEDAVASLGADLGACNSIEYWIVDYFPPASYEYRRRSGMNKAMENAPFLFEPKDFFGFFLRIGWKPKKTLYFATEAERLHRPAPFPLVKRLVLHIVGLFSSPERRQEMKQYAGFVLFEPDKQGKGTARKNHCSQQENQHTKHRSQKQLRNKMKVITAAITLMIVTFFFIQKAPADVYKWVDKNGTIRFSDVPPGSGIKAETIKTQNHPKPNPTQNSITPEPEVETAPPPEKVPQKKKNGKIERKKYIPNGVVIYTTDW